MLLPHLTLKGANVLKDDRIVQMPIHLADGWLVDQPGVEIDLSGCLVLPGIIDLHGDAFERQLAPRPSATFPLESALIATDSDAATNGITTAWIAQSWSWEGGMRSPESAIELLVALGKYRAEAITDLRIQLRVETHTVESRDLLMRVITEHNLDYAVFNNHLPEVRTLQAQRPEELLVWAKKAGRSVDEHVALVDDAFQQQELVPRYLCDLAAAFEANGVRFGSHDDPDARTRVYYDAIGAKICEFPTTFNAARSARSLGNPVLMGAPNVVRGGSQSGNVAAIDLIRAGLCDVLVSDYHYPSLSSAAFKLAELDVLPLVASWRMISSKPAEVMGLSDRGILEVGKRSDLVVVDAKTKRIGATISGGRLSFLSGDIGHRFVKGPSEIAFAAE